MPANFTDENGREWRLRIDGPKAHEIQQATGVNIVSNDGTGLDEVASDPMLLGQTFEILCREQIDRTWVGINDAEQAGFDCRRNEDIAYLKRQIEQMEVAAETAADVVQPDLATALEEAKAELEQVKARHLSPHRMTADDFANLFDNEAVMITACDALQEAVVNFFKSPAARRRMQAILRKTRQIQERLMDQVMDDPEMDQTLMNQMRKAGLETLAQSLSVSTSPAIVKSAPTG